MSQGKPSSDEELRQLLRSGVQPAPAERARRTMPPKHSGGLDDLQSLLRQGATSSTVRTGFESADTAGNASINDILRTSTADGTLKSVRQNAAKPKDLPEEGALDQLLHEVQGGTPLRTAAEQGRPAKAQELSEALKAVHKHSAAADPSAVAKDWLDSRWVMRSAWVFAMAVVFGAGIWWQQRPLPGTPGVLQTLAQAVEHYHKQHGYLPEQISALEGFPKGAVEWSIQYWNARDAQGRPEIIWAPNGKRHYRIILRQGVEVWIYSDKEGKSRLTKSAGR